MSPPPKTNPGVTRVLEGSVYTTYWRYSWAPVPGSVTTTVPDVAIGLRLLKSSPTWARM